MYMYLHKDSRHVHDWYTLNGCLHMYTCIYKGIYIYTCVYVNVFTFIYIHMYIYT